MGFIDDLKRQAKQHKKTIVLPETSDKRTLEAAHKILQESFAHIMLIGEKAEILQSTEFDLSKARFVSLKDKDILQELIRLVVELRKHKGVDEAKAKELLQEPLYFGAALVKSKKADGMVAGAIHATSDVLRAALQIVGTAKDSKLVSSFFVMVVPDCEYGANGTFVFSDCGLCQNPNPDELAQIAVASAKSFQALTANEPFVGMLSYSTYGSAKHPDVDKVIEATRIAKALAPNLKLDGELQLDAAIVPSVGASKAKGSSVAGKANVLIFPNLDAGNIGYKLVQRLAKAQAYGPITQGMASPINDLSRGCCADDIVGVVAITALQAN